MLRSCNAHAALMHESRSPQLTVHSLCEETSFRSGITSLQQLGPKAYYHIRAHFVVTHRLYHYRCRISPRPKVNQVTGKQHTLLKSPGSNVRSGRTDLGALVGSDLAWHDRRPLRTVSLVASVASRFPLGFSGGSGAALVTAGSDRVGAIRWLAFLPKTS